MSYFVNKRRSLGRALDRLQLRNRDFTLFSNDCWGAEVYKHFGLPYNTPFVGLMLMAPCYVRLVQRPQHYLAQPLVFQPQSRYPALQKLQATWKYPFPVATLGQGLGDEGVEIQFLHYHSEEEVHQKWGRRVARINWDNLFIKLDAGKDLATPELIHTFDQLPQPRLTLLREPLVGVDSAVVVPEYSGDGLQQFTRSLPHYDLVGWLNTRQLRPSPLKKIYNRLFFPASD